MLITAHNTRQIAPQRQKVAFGGDLDETRMHSYRNLDNFPIERFLSDDTKPKCISAPEKPAPIEPKKESQTEPDITWKQFFKDPAVQVGLFFVGLLATAMGLGAYCGIQNYRENRLQEKVYEAVSDKKAANKIIENSKLLQGPQDFSFERMDYLKQTLDSVKGVAAHPKSQFGEQLAELNRRDSIRHKADSVNKIVDSLYYLAGMSSPRMSKGYVPYVPKIK